MGWSNGQGMGPTANDVLAAIHQKGIQLWVDGPQLRYKAPGGVSIDDEVRALQQRKAEIIAILTAKRSEAPHELRSYVQSSFPLTYVQQAYWNLHRLVERPATRGIAGAIRLIGELNAGVLERCLNVIMDRQAALRTHIVVSDGVPMQQIAEAVERELQLVNLFDKWTQKTLSGVIREVHQVILEPVSYAAGPLFGTRLLKLGERDHVLIVAMDHMISDGYSLNLLIGEVLTAYTQLERDGEIALPSISVQLADYAMWQRGASPAWVASHCKYWHSRLEVCSRLTFPSDSASAAIGHWAAVPVLIDHKLRTALVEWARVRQTTLVMTVLTAYIVLVMRWCGVNETIIQYQSDGREISPKVRYTIGFFASLLFLRIQVEADDDFTTLLHRVTAEYCSARAHADYGYLAAQTPRPGFTRNTAFNWIPQRSITSLDEHQGALGALTACPIPFGNPGLTRCYIDHEPGVLLYDTEYQVNGTVCFPGSRFSTALMENFGRNFLLVLRLLVDKPRIRVANVVLTC